MVESRTLVQGVPCSAGAPSVVALSVLSHNGQIADSLSIDFGVPLNSEKYCP